MSPGNTSGTEVARDVPPPLRRLMKHVLAPIVMPLLGIIHSVEQGAARLVRALDDPELRSGAFYASRADALTGPVVDQGTIMPEIAQRIHQDCGQARATALRTIGRLRYLPEGDPLVRSTTRLGLG